MNISRVRLLIVALVSLGLAACATGFKATYDSDPSHDFSGYQTYAWLVSAEIVNDAHGNWEPPGFDADAELRFLINRELRNKGLQEVTTRPDLFIAFAAERTQHIRLGTGVSSLAYHQPFINADRTNRAIATARKLLEKPSMAMKGSERA